MKIGDRVKVTNFEPMSGEKGEIISVTKLYTVKLDNGLIFDLNNSQVTKLPIIPLVLNHSRATKCN